MDGRNSNTAAVLLNYVNTIVAALQRRLAHARRRRRPSGTLETRAWFNPNLVSRWFIVPGIVGLLTLVVTTLVTALSVAREREQGTFDQAAGDAVSARGDPARQGAAGLHHRLPRPR